MLCVNCKINTFLVNLVIECPNLSLCDSLFQAVRKLNEAKKLESTAHYSADFGKD